MPKKTKFFPTFDSLEKVVSPSTIAIPHIIIPVQTAQVIHQDDDPGGNDPLPEPEPPPPPYPGPDPPLGWPPIPPSGPVGPGVIPNDTLMPEKGGSSPIILEPVINPPSTLPA